MEEEGEPQHPPAGVNLCKLPSFLKRSLLASRGGVLPRPSLGSLHTSWFREKTQVLRNKEPDLSPTRGQTSLPSGWCARG